MLLFVRLAALLSTILEVHNLKSTHIEAREKRLIFSLFHPHHSGHEIESPYLQQPFCLRYQNHNEALFVDIFCTKAYMKLASHYSVNFSIEVHWLPVQFQTNSHLEMLDLLPLVM